MILGHDFRAWERKTNGEKCHVIFWHVQWKKKRKNGLNRANLGHFIKYTIKTLKK